MPTAVEYAVLNEDKFKLDVSAAPEMGFEAPKDEMIFVKIPGISDPESDDIIDIGDLPDGIHNPDTDGWSTDGTTPAAIIDVGDLPDGVHNPETNDVVIFVSLDAKEDIIDIGDLPMGIHGDEDQPLTHGMVASGGGDCPEDAIYWDTPDSVVIDGSFGFDEVAFGLEQHNNLDEVTFTLEHHVDMSDLDLF